MSNREQTPRLITDTELRVLLRALEVGAPGLVPAEVLATLPSQKVVPGCECDCGSFDFVGHALSRPRDLAHAIQILPDGRPIGIIVWGTPERISGVEFWDVFEHSMHILPDPSQIQAGHTKGSFATKFQIARALVTDANGRILLVRQTFMPGWRLPGGIIVGRNGDATTKIYRELAEEAGLIPDFVPPVLLTRGKTIVYHVTHFSQTEPTRYTENTAARFFDPNALPLFATPLTRKAVVQWKAVLAPS